MPEGVKLLKFWVQVTTFMNYFHEKKKEDFDAFADNIYQKYMKTNSPLYIEFPNNFSKDINSHSILENIFSEEYMDECINYAVETIRGYYYLEFSNSDEFSKLLISLENDEKVYSKLFKIHMFYDSEQMV